MPETPTFGRYAEIPYDEMTPEQQEAYRSRSRPAARSAAPTRSGYTTPNWRRCGPFGGHFQPGNYSLSEREREIAVIVINSKWRSAYPTAAHERRGKEVGLPANKVEAMLTGADLVRGQA